MCLPFEPMSPLIFKDIGRMPSVNSWTEPLWDLHKSAGMDSSGKHNKDRDCHIWKENISVGQQPMPACLQAKVCTMIWRKSYLHSRMA